MYRFSPEQQEALGCWEAGYNAIGKGMYGNVYDEAAVELAHGTHTAGIIGAEWNGFGTSGVASNVRIVCIDLSDEQGNESLADALVAYDFVNRFNEQAPEEERIRVTSNSWSRYASSRALDAVLRDLGERWGIVNVFSAGNDGKNNDRYEKTPSSSADNPYVIVVANSIPTDQLDSSSEYGTATVDIAAPGTNIISTTVGSRGAYYPDAASESNLLYFGFDGEDDLPIRISQVYGEGELKLYEDEYAVREHISSTVSSVHFYGPGCLKIELDPGYKIEGDWGDLSDVYDLQFDIDLAGTDIAERLDGVRGLRLGLAYSTEEGSGCLASYASSNAAFITTNVANMDEDAEEEMTQIIRPVASSASSYSVAGEAQWGFSDFLITTDEFIDEDYNEELDPNVAAVSPEGDILRVKVRVQLSEGCTTLYIDSLGVGTQVAPYEYATGTSMACPAVAGAAAVFASQGYEGAELAMYVRSKVRIPKNGLLATRSGGVLDFTVVGSPDSGEDGEALAPAIREIVADGTSLTVRGQNFGSAPGAAALARYVVGADLEPLAASVVSWADDEVTFELETPAEGIIRVELANAGGKYDTRMHFVSKSANIYEQDLPLNTETADVTDAGDGNGDWETRGPLVGLGCKLYYLPAYCGMEDAYPAYRRIRCFDLKTQEWTDLSELPEWLQEVSAVMYDGKIVVEGATMHVTEWGEPSGYFPEGKRKERVYVYDPETGTWSQASSEGIYLGQTIVNDGGQLKIVGGSLPDPNDPDNEYYNDPVPLRSYDLANGAGEELCSMPADFRNPIAAVKDGTILIYSAAPGCEFIRVQDGKAVLLEEAAPDFFLASHMTRPAVHLTVIRSLMWSRSV